MRAVAHANSVGIPARLATSHSKHAVDHARNRGVAGFLKTNATHLFMVDDDVLIPEDAIEILASMDAGITAGCYAGVKLAYKSGPILIPYVMVQVDHRWMSNWFDGIVECDAVGGGCMMIRRDVLDAVGFPWFRWPQSLENGDVFHFSDDIDFCNRARENGFSIKAHGNVRCSHITLVDVAMMIPPVGNPAFDATWRGPKSVAEQEAWPGYGTHVPVLRALGRFMGEGAKRVVEYGAGNFSTMTFLDTDHFPNVVSVLSYESDSHWAMDLQSRIHDDRLSIYLTPIDRMIDNLHDDDADIVLIDCDEKPPADERGRPNPDRFDARIALIRAYQDNQRAVVVVHDSNFASIGPVVESSTYRHRFTFKPRFGPSTTVLSNAIDVSGLIVMDSPLRLLRNLDNGRPNPRAMEAVPT